MAFERVMGLDVIDDEEYQRYREGMSPILESFGGSFGYDFKIAEVMKSKAGESINRVFTIEFPSKEVMEEFFADPGYLRIREKHFNSSVRSSTVISMHEKHT